MIVILLSIKVISLSIRAWSRATCCDYFWRRWCKSEEECQYFIIWQILWKGPQLHCWYKNNLAFILKSQLFLNYFSLLHRVKVFLERNSTAYLSLSLQLIHGSGCKYSIHNPLSTIFSRLLISHQSNDDVKHHQVFNNFIGVSSFAFWITTFWPTKAFLSNKKNARYTPLFFWTKNSPWFTGHIFDVFHIDSLWCEGYIFKLS